MRSECVDWLVIVTRSQLERSLHTYVDHYNRHRPHRALGLGPPQSDAVPRLPDAEGERPCGGEICWADCYTNTSLQRDG